MGNTTQAHDIFIMKIY